RPPGESREPMFHREDPQRLMTRRCTFVVILCGVACLAVGMGKVSAADEKRKEAKTAPADRFGDPLPPGAVARLGTTRFRYDATAVAYSPDGKWLALGGSDNHIRLLDTNGKEVRRLAGHQPRTFRPARDLKGAFDLLVDSVGKGHVTCIAFSPDGKTLASGGWDEAVRLGDVQSGQERRRLDGHSRGMIGAVAFSPDGKYLASRGGLDGTLILWDAESGKQVSRIDKLSNVNPWRFNRSAALAF